MKPLVIIPARSGSKGVPGKNIKFLNGKPLIYYTIEAAREIIPDEIICVSTDSKEIKKTVERIGLNVPFIRPKELGTDTASTYDVLLHAFEYYKKNDYEADTIILLQPTSPFRKAFHIKEALRLYSPSMEMLVSVKETKANPYFTLKEEDNNGFLVSSKKSEFQRRQDCPKVYELNGAIYIINMMALKEKPLNKMTKVNKYLMDEISSLDIDKEVDWTIAEALINFQS